MNIETLSKIKETKYFYQEMEKFLNICKKKVDLLTIGKYSEVEMTKEDKTSFYSPTILFPLQEDKEWKKELFASIKDTFETYGYNLFANYDYLLINEYFNTKIISEAEYSLSAEEKIFNHQIFVFEDKIHAEIKHPLLRAYFQGYDTKSSLEYLKKIDEKMYRQFFPDDILSIVYSEMFFAVPETKKRKEWNRYIEEAFQEFEVYRQIYEEIKEMLFSSVLEKTTEFYFDLLEEM